MNNKEMNLEEKILVEKAERALQRNNSHITESGKQSLIENHRKKKQKLKMKIDLL